MAEDPIKSEIPEVKVPLRGPEAAKATLERLQQKGILPTKKEDAVPETPVVPPFPEIPQGQPYDAAKKAFPQEPEVRAKIIESYGGTDTISPAVKQELTSEARKLNTIAMGTGEASSEAEQPPKVPPFTESPSSPTPPLAETPATPPVEHLEAKSPLKRMLEGQKPVESTYVPGSSRFKVPPEAERIPPSQRPLEKMPPVQQVPLSVRPPMPEEALRTHYNKTQPEQPKQSFFGSLWNRIRGRA